MTRSLIAIATLVITAGCVGTTPEEAPGRQIDALGENQFYVVAWNGSVPADADALVADAGGELLQTLDALDASLVQSASPDFTAALGLSSSVLAVGAQGFQALPESAATVELEDDEPPLAGFLDGYQWNIRRVNAPAAWDVTMGSHDTVVAVIDTGVAWNHPDLAPNVVYASCAALTVECNPYPSISSHGTHVAGTIAGDGYGVVGVGPDLGIASYNVFEYVEGYGVVAFDWPIYVAVVDAVEQGFDVVNMSLGGYGVRNDGASASWRLWNRAANYAIQNDVVIVAAAGNDDLDLNGPIAHVPSDLPGVVSVGATGIAPAALYPYPGSYDVRAPYSNTGAAVTLSAPGGDVGPEELVTPYHWHLILSTYVYYPGNEFGVPVDPACAENWNCPLGWAWMAGTSMAYPHVAGVAGLAREVDPSLTARQAANLLKRTAEDIGDRFDFGHGMVDAEAAVR